MSDPTKKVFSNGTLVLLKVSKSRDKGRYSCMAKNRQGQRAEGSTELQVIGKCVRIRTVFHVLIVNFKSLEGYTLLYKYQTYLSGIYLIRDHGRSINCVTKKFKLI